MSLPFTITLIADQVAGAASHVAGWLTAAPSPTNGSGNGSGIDLNAPAQPIPGMGGTFSQWIGWAKSIGMFAGVIGLIACAVMMMVGRRNRSHLAAEGAIGVPWVLAGLSLIALAPGVVSAVLGG